MDTVIHLARGPGDPGAVPVRLQTIRRAGDWLAIAEIQTPDGPLRFTGCASEKTVSGLLRRAGLAQPQTTAAGFDFGELGKSIAQFAQSSAAKQALAGVQTVTKNPLLMAAASAIPGVGPAMATISTAATAAQAAQSLLGRGAAGDPVARNHLAAIRRHARSNPRAARMAQILDAVQAAKPAPAPTPTQVMQVPGFDPYSLMMQAEAAQLLGLPDVPVAAGAVLAQAPFYPRRQPSPALLMGLTDLMRRARALPMA